VKKAKDFIKNNWKDLLFIIVILLFCIMFTICIRFFPMNDDGHFLSLYAIQSSISILGIAILSLLSGTLNDTYLGMKVSTYFVSKHSTIFKSKYITTTQIILILTGLFALVMKWHIFIPISLIISALLTLRHIYLIVGIYNDSEKIKQNIENYLINVIINGNDASIISTIDMMEKSLTNFSIQNIKSNFESTLLFYLKVQGIVIRQKTKDVRYLVEQSFARSIKKYIAQFSGDAISLSLDLISKSIDLYSSNNLICNSYGKEQFNNLSEVLRSSEDTKIVDYQSIFKFYKSYLANIQLTEDVYHLYQNDYSTVLTRYLYDVFVLNPHYASKQKSYLKSFVDYLLLFHYEVAIPNEVKRDILAWFLINSDDFKQASRLFSSMQDHTTIESKSNFNLILIIILIYQIIQYENASDLRNPNVKETLRYFVLRNRDMSSILYDLMFDSRMFEALSLDKIDSFISGWIYALSIDIENRNYSHHNTIEEFLTLLYVSSPFDAQQVAEKLNEKNVSAFSIANIFKDEIIRKEKLLNFQKILLNNEKEQVEQTEKLDLVMSILMKIQFIKRFDILSDEVIYEYEKSKSKILESKLKSKLDGILGYTSKNSKSFVYTATSVENINENSQIFDNLIVNHIVDYFITNLLERHIKVKLTEKTIDQNKEKSLTKILTDVRNMKILKIDTVMGYRKDFFGYAGREAFQNFINQIETKIEYNQGYNIFCLLDSKQIKLNIFKTEVKVLKTSTTEYLKRYKYRMLDEKTYEIEIGTTNVVVISHEELENFIANSIRKIEYRMHYKVQFDRKRIGNIYKF
jgi:hypothetical protein